MKFVYKLLLGLVPCILILAAVCLIVYAANHLPGWVVLPLSVPAIAMTWHEIR